MDISLRQLRAYLAVARTLSFTRAAAETHQSQPALTLQIGALEDRLGVKLFDRNSRTVELTRLGRELLPAFQRIVRELDETVTGAREVAGMGAGKVRLAVLPSFAASRLPEIIVRFRAAFPRVELTVKDAISSQVAELVHSGAADFGVLGGESIPAGLEVLHRGSDRLCAILPRDHPLARKKKLRPADLAAHPLILLDTATSVRQGVDQALAGQARRIKVACEVTYMMTAVAMVRAGLGITILPESAHEPRAEPELVSRPVDDPRFMRSICVVKQRRRTLPPGAEHFIAILVEELATS